MIDLTKKAWARKLHPAYEKKTYYTPKNGSVDRKCSGRGLEGSLSDFPKQGIDREGITEENSTESL